jgi:hypothetical protein
MATYLPHVFDYESSTLQLQLRNELPVTAARLAGRRICRVTYDLPHSPMGLAARADAG